MKPKKLISKAKILKILESNLKEYDKAHKQLQITACTTGDATDWDDSRIALGYVHAYQDLIEALSVVDGDTK